MWTRTSRVQYCTAHGSATVPLPDGTTLLEQYGTTESVVGRATFNEGAALAAAIMYYHPRIS